MSLALATVLSLLCTVPPEAHPAPPPPRRQEPPPPLSKEDAELVKQLALLEQLDLVKNLDLFDDKAPAPEKEPQRQP